MKNITGFEFKREYYDFARCLTGQERLDFYESIMRYVFDGGRNPNKMSKTALPLIQSQLDRDTKVDNEPVIIVVK